MRRRGESRLENADENHSEATGAASGGSTLGTGEPWLANSESAAISTTAIPSPCDDSPWAGLFDVTTPGGHDEGRRIGGGRHGGRPGHAKSA